MARMACIDLVDCMDWMLLILNGVDVLTGLRLREVFAALWRVWIYRRKLHIETVDYP